MDLLLTLLGTSASVPTAARGVSSVLLVRGGERLLIDCGEGTQRQLLRSGLGLADVDAVLLTHLHADHYLGLPGLLKTYGLRGRERSLRVVGPRGLRALLASLGGVIGRLPFRLEIDETEGGAAWRCEGAQVVAYPTRHSVRSLGFALVEDERPGSFDVETARALGVPEGPLFGRLQRGEAVESPSGTIVRPEQVLGMPRSGRRVVVTGDTEPCEATLEAARGASLLVHEATFVHEERDRARETRHSTGREAAILAREADVGLLVLTHLGGRATPRELRREAESEFGRVLVGRDFDQIEVPNPEHGGPIVHRARDRPSERGPMAASPGPAGRLVEDDL